MAQKGARSDPKRPQEEFKRVKKANPNSKTKKGPNQDDPKTVLDRPWGRVPPVYPHPMGTIWAPKTAPKSTLKRSKNETKNQDEKKAIQDDLRPILGGSWAVLGCHLGRRNAPNPYKMYCLSLIHI